MATRLRSPRLQTASVALGLMTASATIVHIFGGATVAHFHFFVMIGLLAIYEDWLPYGLGIAYVFVHHLVLGAVMPHAVFEHGGNVLPMAVVHAAFIAAACVAQIVMWRANEREREATREALERVRLQYDFTGVLAASASLEAAVPELLAVVGRRLRWDVAIFWRQATDGRLQPRTTWHCGGAHLQDAARAHRAAAYAPGSGLCGRAFVSGRPAWTEDLSADSSHPEPGIVRQAGLRGAIALPLRAGADVLGVITFASHAPRRYDADAVLMLERLADQLAIFVDRVHRAEQVDVLTDLAMTDALTGLPNRRAWDARLREHAAWAEREQQPLSLAVVDLDHFKTYNDTHGHQAGDALLAAAARRWRRLLRPQDLLARYGGEEFAVVLPGCDLDEAREIADRLRRNVPLRQTCSIGLVVSSPGEPLHELVARADAALYEAKAAGRNRIRATARPTGFRALT